MALSLILKADDSVLRLCKTLRVFVSALGLFDIDGKVEETPPHPLALLHFKNLFFADFMYLILEHYSETRVAFRRDCLTGIENVANKFKSQYGSNVKYLISGQVSPVTVHLIKLSFFKLTGKDMLVNTLVNSC